MMGHKPRSQLAWLPITLIVLIAFALRVWALDEVPPGVTHDEAAHLQDAGRIWDGARPIYLTTAYGREPFFDYATAPLVGLLGMRVTTGRLASALWGTSLVALLYAWVARAFDRPTALLAAGLLALSFWPLSTSRQILRSITMPVLLMAAAGLYWQAIFPSGGTYRRRYFVLAGFLLGLSFYTYMPARITWLAPVLLNLSFVLTDRPRWRKTRRGLGIMLLVMALTAGPLIGYLLAHPELEVRLSELAAPIQALRLGDPGPLWSRLSESVLLFSHQGDPQGIYNIAGRPLLPPVLAGLFYVGIAMALANAVGRLRQRRPACQFLLLCLLLGVAPALATGLESSSLRAIAAQPAVFVLIALPLAAIGRLFLGRGALGRYVWASLLVVAGALLLTFTTRDYFGHWATQRDTRVAYHSHLAEMMRYLDAQPESGPVAVSTIYPGPYHDPYAAETISGRVDLIENLRWYDARFALLYPDTDHARALFPALAPLDPILKTLFEPTATLLERVELEADDLSPWFELYQWEPRIARSALPLNESLDLEALLRFVGYDLRTPAASPGDEVVLITFWEPLASFSAGSAGDDLVLFTHLLDGEEVGGQEDQLDVPPSSWHLGDLFAQLHRVPVPVDLPAGLYPLQIGAYWRTEGAPRLTVSDGDRVLGNQIPLPAVQVLAVGED